MFFLIAVNIDYVREASLWQVKNGVSLTQMSTTST